MMKSSLRATGVLLLLTACGGGTNPDTDGGMTIDAAQSDGGSAATDGGSSPTDAGPTPTDGGSSPTDAGSTPTDGGNQGGPGVTCGDATCSDTQVCCTSFAMGMLTQTCTTQAMCMGAALACDGPEDCDVGQVCCATGGPGGGGGGTACRAEAQCTFGRQCHTTADCTGEDTCCPFMGRNVCSPFCP